MKKLTLIAILIGFSSFLFAQNKKTEPFKTNAFYVDLGGNSLFYSLNFEKQSKLSDISRTALSLGVECLPSVSVYSHQDFGPAMCLIPAANILFGKRSHHFETGLALFAGSRKSTMVISGRIGYRFQPKNGGFLFRIGYTPLFIGGNIVSYAGISFGQYF